MLLTGIRFERFQQDRNVSSHNVHCTMTVGEESDEETRDVVEDAIL